MENNEQQQCEPPQLLVMVAHHNHFGLSGATQTKKFIKIIVAVRIGDLTTILT